MHPTQRLLPSDTDLDANNHGNGGSLKALVQPLLKTQILLDWLSLIMLCLTTLAPGLCTVKEKTVAFAEGLK